MRAGVFKFLRKYAKARTRAARGSKKRQSIISYRSGRNIKPVPFQPGQNVLASLLTVLGAVGNGHYHLGSRKFRIEPGDFQGWEKLERQSLTLVLLIDVSKSTYPFISIFTEILNSLTGYFRLHQDRIGLISLSGHQAQVMNHPTHNYRVVTRNLMKLKVEGLTPLADGLFKALAMIRLERYRKPGSVNLAILLSDCYPEPLTHKFRDIFEEPAYRDSLRAAALFHKQKVSLLVINPSFRNTDQVKYLPGERLSISMAAESRGRLIKLFRYATLDTPFASRTYQPPSRGEINQILSGIEGMLGSRPRERDGLLPA